MKNFKRVINIFSTSVIITGILFTVNIVNTLEASNLAAHPFPSFLNKKFKYNPSVFYKEFNLKASREILKSSRNYYNRLNNNKIMDYMPEIENDMEKIGEAINNIENWKTKDGTAIKISILDTVGSSIKGEGKIKFSITSNSL